MLRMENPLRWSMLLNPTLIVMLGGGDKSTQSADIAKAIKLAATIQN